MIKIFQEHGEVVCVIGNAIKYENGPIYLQADLSIGCQSQEINCLNNSNSNIHPLISSANLIDYESCGSFAFDLNCLICELVMQKNSSFQIIAILIQTARKYFINLQQAVSFYLGCCLFLHFIILVDYCAFLPTIFNGVQIFWLLLIIFPILSLSLMFSHKPKNLMKNLNTKRNQFLNKSFFRGFRSFLILTLPVSIFFVILFAVYVFPLPFLLFILFIWFLLVLLDLLGAILDQWKAYLDLVIIQ